ncbi:metal-dependent hydrolase [Halopseudomonas nanhaiensis]|uniref:metal-dependent hydrolase n=1 Tax=Halopseudomonas nanhaiensis TaxID=2830842 RepID=UPI001CBCA4C6|nr:metal-dependent hydrolase [Halopseudomonas nanhaiensis]UAW97602.1 metal-dependent hydrolase [Halopseudomonas nanhaiensis]
MDSLTQAVLGASVQGAVLGRFQGRRALVYGALLGTLPDMDVLVDFGDAVADMTYHRGFSHSVFVLGTLAVLLTWVTRRLFPDARYSAGRLFTCIALVLLTHVSLDAFTTYGTQLFWPLTTPPVAISSIFIIDPLYTVPLLVAVIAGLLIGLGRSGLRWQYGALALSTLYLFSTLAGKHMAEDRLEQALALAEIEPDHVFSSPTPFNTLLWRVVAVDGDDYYEGLVGWLDDAPPPLERLPRHATDGQQALLTSPQHHRLRWFTRDTLRYDLIDNHWVVTDLRLGMTGYHPFRFALARETKAGERQIIADTEHWPVPEADYSRLRDLWRRAIDPSYRLSLAELAADLNAGAEPSGLQGRASGSPLQ